jgi:hypothetical protein
MIHHRKAMKLMAIKQLVLNGDNANNPEAVGSNPTPATNF